MVFKIKNKCKEVYYSFEIATVVKINWDFGLLAGKNKELPVWFAVGEQD